MTIPCKVNTGEMREAFRMNLTPAFWWKAALGNIRAIIYLVVLVGIVLSRVVGGRDIEWKNIAVLLGLIAAFFSFYLLRLHGTIKKTATALQTSCSTLIVDTQGLTAEAPNGARAFTPWSAISRWREGKLVFTIGDAKTFRTVPKSGLNEMQAGELRSLLMSRISVPLR
jgi:hypothetical protein